VVTPADLTRQLSRLSPFVTVQSLTVITTLASRLPFSWLSKESTSEDVLRRMAMATVIEFYIPARFRKRVKWTPPAERGKVLEFPVEMRKSA
jgi:hypothetical protein